MSIAFVDGMFSIYLSHWCSVNSKPAYGTIVRRQGSMLTVLPQSVPTRFLRGVVQGTNVKQYEWRSALL